MPIKKFTDRLSDLDRDFLNKKVHIICLAVNSLTMYNAFAHAIGGMSSQQAGQLAETVNLKNETRTLFPKFSLTIIPLSIFNNRNDFNNEAIMKKHITDCFEAETKYIKSSRMIFIFEKRHDFNNELALKVLLENWANTKLNVEYQPD